MMHVRLFDKSLEEFSGNTAIFFAHALNAKSEKLPAPLHVWDKKLHAAFTTHAKEEGAGAKGELFSVHTLGNLPVRKIMLAGLGEEKKTQPAQGMSEQIQEYKQAVHTIVRVLEKHKDKKAMLVLPQLSQVALVDMITLTVETLMFAGYHFTKYMSEKKTQDIEVFLAMPGGLKPTPDATRAFEMGKILGESADLARDLANEPSNILFPEAFAEIAARECKKIPGLLCRILRADEIEKQGMGLLAAVGQGSVHKPCLVVVEYRGGKKQDSFEAFVGKGICFDSGGISLKTGEAAYSMSHMKRDMAGAACVLGVMKAIASLKLPMNAVGVMSMAENMPDGASHKPGDILKSLSGKTVEIYHTDAEGRLVIADGITYAQKHYKVSTMVDIATLTGEVMRVFGPALTAAFANNNELYRDLKHASRLTGESMWRMPLYQPYVDKVKGAFADLRELNFEMPNAIASALFLQQFVEKDVSWAHLDIAGTEEYTLPQGGKGSTASAVRLLAHYLAQKYKK